MKKRLAVLTAAGLLLVAGIGAAAHAAPNVQLSQTVNDGALTTDVLDSLHNSVALPTAALSAKNFSFECQSQANASTGTIGDDDQRIYLSNPGAADNGWTLTIAPTDGPAALWMKDGTIPAYDHNDPQLYGCIEGLDGDGYAGELSIDPSTALLSPDCDTCTLNGVTKGTQGNFKSTVESITLINAADTSDDLWRGYMANIPVSQSIPAETLAGSYSFDMTVTATAQ